MERIKQLLYQCIELAIENIDHGGGPFAAIVTNEQNEIMVHGCNGVQTLNDSTAHAEIQAIRNAQKFLNTYNLSGCNLYTSATPCIQCFGAIYWSGIKNVYVGAAKEFTEEIGFDEGPVSDELWQIAKNKKGINYFTNLLPDHVVCRPFDRYLLVGGKIY